MGRNALEGNYTFHLFWELILELIEEVLLLKTHKRRNYVIGLLISIYIL